MRDGVRYIVACYCSCRENKILLLRSCAHKWTGRWKLMRRSEGAKHVESFL